jgi:hypothetical protein
VLDPSGLRYGPDQVAELLAQARTGEVEAEIVDELSNSLPPVRGEGDGPTDQEAP